MSAQEPLQLGVDVGSTTLKVVLLDGETVVASAYRRHHADIEQGLGALLDELAADHPGAVAQVAVAGSGGLGVSELLDLTFVQEVVACTAAVRRLVPDADVVIELGGEDAKITYLTPMLEQRMNGACAGGTGAFVDQMATLLHTDAAGLDELAAGYETLYPIASRCGVFAKSDVQPLINEGAPREDLAASIFQAVAVQTVSGLSGGHPIRGHVVFLGGPLHFLPQLRAAFIRVLGDRVHTSTSPQDGQLYVARGAAMLATGEPMDLADLAARLRERSGRRTVSGRMTALFPTERDRQQFVDRHAAATVERIDPAEVTGACFLGIDAGSTTIKAVVLDDQERVVWSRYQSNGGDPVSAAVQIVRDARRALPGKAVLARSCVTGYGEGLVRAALHIDDGEVETMAHYRAAEHLLPGVTSVVDVGGQDMKYLRVRDGVIDSIAVNEACSSGCGSFLQTFAETMGLDIESFTAAAVQSRAPVDLGSRCTVFMNSSVKQAQKEGAGVDDIAAGLCYAVVRNALFKVIRLRDAGELGDRVVVQGGTFLSDGVLRAFELLTGREVVRPDAAGLMGAIGAALIARANLVPGHPSRLLPTVKLRDVTVTTSTEVCRLCQNHCQCTVSEFPDGGRFVSGNRCDRGADASKPASERPNLFDFTYKRLFRYRRLTEKAATRGTIGVPRALNMYENYPLWFTVLTALKFRVVISGRSSGTLAAKGLDSVVSENVCYPAKLVHGHVEDLVDKGVRTIWYPSVAYEQDMVDGADDHYSCPVVSGYPQVIKNNLERIRTEGVRLLDPYLNLADPELLVTRLVDVFDDWGVTEEEARAAVQAGFAEDAAVRADIRAAGREAMAYMERTGTRGVVLAGRPYHVDPEINHGIPELVTGLGLVVLTEDAVLGLDEVERPLRVRDQWAYHSRLYQAAGVVAAHEDLSLVQLTSFGCGLDAITADQVAEVLTGADDVYTALKIDEVANLGAARIRLRSLDAATRERAARTRPAVTEHPGHVLGRTPFTKEEKAKHTIIAPQLSPVHFALLEPAFRAEGYRVEVQQRVSTADVDAGLTFVNNDACYPAILVVGQLVNAFKEGRYDPASTTVMITQTGGMCRATNYTALLRRALRDAGYAQVPVLAISTGGLEDNPGFTITPRLLHRGVMALVLGDLLQSIVLRLRPYEAVPGSVQALADRWQERLSGYLSRRGLRGAWRRLRGGYRRLVHALVRDFDALTLRDVPRRPRVGIVGEILVKFHPDANNHVIEVIEAEGCEAVLPGLTEFFVNGLYSAEWNEEHLGTGGNVGMRRMTRRVVEAYQEPVRAAIRAADGDFDAPMRMDDLVVRAQQVTTLGHQAGEGWLLTAEILHLIDSGAPNVVCVQPFACLPNHIVGKGMFAPIRRAHPQANLVAVDYDPGASEVNQLNRIKLMIATAMEQEDQGPSLPEGRTLLPLASVGRG